VVDDGNLTYFIIRYRLIKRENIIVVIMLPSSRVLPTFHNIGYILFSLTINTVYDKFISHNIYINELIVSQRFGQYR
jgi:hypothetical protein